MTATFRATHRHAHLAPRKALGVMTSIRGLPAGEALDRLSHDKKRAAAMVEKVLASAVANALQHPDVRPNRLVVSHATVGNGPLLMGRLRFRPGPMGRAMPFRRRTCHLQVHVSDPQVAASAHTGSGDDAGQQD